MKDERRNPRLVLLSVADTVIAANRCSDEADTPPLPFGAPVQPRRPNKGMVHGISPDELTRLAPKLRRYLGRPDLAWPDILTAADWLAPGLCTMHAFSQMFLLCLAIGGGLSGELVLM
jgi:hypothetical protein